MKLGFTFYPKDWWTSDTFYDLSPVERYLYLEFLFLMYANSGVVANDKNSIERRLSCTISDNVWLKVTGLLTKTDEGFLTHRSVNSRLKKTLANRENGKLGGRPKNNDEKNPNNPNQKPNGNPPLEREREKKEKYKLISIDSAIAPSDKQFFLIAKSFHSFFIEVKGKIKSLVDADYEKWVNTVRLLITSDKVDVKQLIAIKLYLEDAHKGIKGTDPFWIETIYSLKALRKKSKDDVYYFDMIGQQVKKWLENSDNYARVQQAFKKLEHLVNGN